MCINPCIHLRKQQFSQFEGLTIHSSISGPCQAVLGIKRMNDDLLLQLLNQVIHFQNCCQLIYCQSFYQLIIQPYKHFICYFNNI